MRHIIQLKGMGDIIELENVRIIIQPEIVSSVIITLALCLFFVYAGRKLAKANPLEKPKGIVLAVETVVNIFQNFFHTIFPNQKMEKSLSPYFMVLALFIFTSNISGLVCLESPTSNFSITLTLALITFAMIQLTALKKKGTLKYVWNLIWPPTNILSTLAPLISLSMRIFGNIVSGGILMSLVYAATGYLSGLLFSFIPINVVGPIIAPVLHAYFDVFAGFIQTFIFVTLSSVYISMEA